MRPARPKKPNPGLVHEYSSRFDMDDRYGPVERVLARIFADHPSNIGLEDVLTKVVLLNGLYNTNVFAVLDMAKHICGLDIDSQLSEALPDAVDRIALLTVSGITRRHYSFATKYCSWHSPHRFPIFDSRVEWLIWQYQRADHFATFQRLELHLYSHYRDVIEAFRRSYGLEECSFKEIDKFLWLHGGELQSAPRTP